MPDAGIGQQFAIVTGSLRASLKLPHRGLKSRDILQPVGWAQVAHPPCPQWLPWIVDRSRSSRRGRKLLLDRCTHLEDREIHRDNKAANEYAKYRHDQGLKQAAECIHRIINLLLVKVRDLA